MQKTLSLRCPKCNNVHSFYRYGKDKDGYQKYQCRKCNHQFVPDRPTRPRAVRNYPRCPICGHATFPHHDKELYTQYKCGNRKCNHSFFLQKPLAIPPASVSTLLGKTDFKKMRFPVHIILSALTMFYIGKNSFRNISLIFRITYNVKVSHTTIANWCKQFAPLFQNLSLDLIPLLDFDSDEWHADETVVKIKGVKHYIWFIIDSETRFVLGFHLSPRRDSTQAFTLFDSVRHLGCPDSIVSDRLWSYEQPTKTIFSKSKHIQVASFKDDISNNLIESFNHQFKAWYRSKQGFCSFESANNMISMFVFFFNFVRPHSSLNNLTPAQVAGLDLSKKEKRKYLLVA